MADKRNPGALAGATGAGKPCHATAAGTSSIAHWKPLGKIVAAVASQAAQRWGKSVMQMLKVWRKHRGARGSPGEGMISQVASRVDQMLVEDRERKARLRQ